MPLTPSPLNTTPGTPGYNSAVLTPGYNSANPTPPPTSSNGAGDTATAQNGNPIAAPAGAQQSANGLWYSNGQAYQLPPTQAQNFTQGNGTLTANISTPANANTTVSPPTVVTSQAATADLANKQTQATQLNSDVQNQSTIQSQNQQSNGLIPPAGAGTQTQSSSTQTPSNTGVPALDDQINQLLSDLSTNTTNIQNTASQNESGILSEQDQNIIDQNNAYADTASKLSAIASGTYPLSPAEQQLLTATAQAYQQTIAAQNTANQAYTGQMAEAMASLGISTSAPTQAMGQIQAAISTGQTKIAALDGQMAQSLATLQQGFQKQDFDMVQSAWEDAAKQFEDRQSELQTMLSTIQTQAKNQTDEIQAQTSTAIDALTKSATLSFQEKDALIKNALAQGQLDEKTADDKTKNLIAEYTAGMTSGTGSGNTLPTVANTANGNPDPVAQAQFLSQFPPQVASLIKGVANYDINPSSISTSKKQAMGGFTQSQIVSLASQYNPNFDEKSYATRSAMQKNITSGQYSQVINGANTAIQHLNELSQDYASLGNGTFPILNAGKNTFQSIGGGSAQNNFKITADAVASELSKIYKGTGSPTESEIENWRASISDNMSPQAFQGAIKTGLDLMAGKLSTLSDNYTSTMGQPGNFQILTDANAKVLQNLGIDPTTVDPTYGNSPTIKLQTFNGASTQNAQLLQQINKVMPNADPTDVVQYLQSKGYQI